VCLCICLSARIFPVTRARSLPNVLWILLMTVARSSSGVVAICYVLPVLRMTSCFFYDGSYSSMNFAATDRFCVNLLICRKDGQNSIHYIKGYICDYLFRNYLQTKVKEKTEKFDD